MTEEYRYQEKWREWNRLGLIPGPDETEAALAERAAFCQNLEQHLVQKVGAELPFDLKDQSFKVLLEEVFPLTEELYGISPQWVPLFFSNHHLAPWHGGCAWIFQLDEESPTSAFLQLRARFRTSDSFLGIYHRKELIAHELAHVGRMLYQEPQFEEFFAYQSSQSKWRRWLGPIVQSSRESLFFILLLAIVIMADFATLSLGPNMAMLAWWIKLVPVVVVFLGLGRLFLRHRQIKKCLLKLKTLFDTATAHHLLYRLRDHEIKQFSKNTPSQIKNFIEESSNNSFRWQFLKNIYQLR